MFSNRKLRANFPARLRDEGFDLLSGKSAVWLTLGRASSRRWWAWEPPEPIAEILYEFVQGSLQIWQIQGKLGHYNFPAHWDHLMLSAVIGAASSDKRIKRVQVLPALCNWYLDRGYDDDYGTLSHFTGEGAKKRFARFSRRYDEPANCLGFRMADEQVSRLWGDEVRRNSLWDFEDRYFGEIGLPPFHTFELER